MIKEIRILYSYNLFFIKRMPSVILERTSKINFESHCHSKQGILPTRF